MGTCISACDDANLHRIKLSIHTDVDKDMINNTRKVATAKSYYGSLHVASWGDKIKVCEHTLPVDFIFKRFTDEGFRILTFFQDI